MAGITVVLFFTPGLALRALPAVEQGQIRLSDMRIERHQEQLTLNVRAVVELPQTVRAGLDSGVMLTFVLKFEVLHDRRYGFDALVLERQQRYTLTYYELTRHYRLNVTGTDISYNYRSMTQALSGLGQLPGLRFILSDAEQKQWLAHRSAQQSLSGVVHMQLLRSALPLPLQPIIRSSWSLASEEYRWPLI